MERRWELLAPAGDAAALSAALKAGADAVYFGIDAFNMRQRARNFALADLPRIRTMTRDAGARAYLAMNTIVFEEEIGALETVLDAASAAGIDAVIAWDPAVIRGARRRELEVHLSTQASVSNSAGIIEAYERHGIRRFVLARECGLDRIDAIRRALTEQLGPRADRIELEAFVHGAMCVSESGRCFLSEFSTGDSGNRGACLQPCRRRYRIIDVEGEYEFEMGEDYILSPRDLCTLPFLEKILDSGIRVLKIEGRMRNPEYVSTVVGVYREALDFWIEGDPGDTAAWEALKEAGLLRLRSVYNRGFSSGFYMGRPIGDWTEAPDSQATRRKETVGIVVNYFRRIGVAEIKVQSAGFSLGDELMIQGPTTGSLAFTVNSMEIDQQPVRRAERVESVTVEVPGRVRRNDAVYRRFDA